MAKFLISGITGYIGSKLAHYLVETGHEVHGIVRDESNLERVNHILSSLFLITIDELVRVSNFSHNQYDAIIHTATCYEKGNKTIDEVIQTNLFFSIELLRYAADSKIGVFINMDSYFCKNNKNNFSYKSSYVISKSHFRDWGIRFSSSGSIKFWNIILEHPYGPLESQDKFTGWLFKNCLDNVKVLDLTLGHQKRDFIYIEDIINALATILLKMNKISERFCDIGLGNGFSISLERFVHMVHSISDSKTILRFGAIKTAEDEIQDSFADLTVLNKLGWKPEFSIESGISDSVGAYRNSIFS